MSSSFPECWVPSHAAYQNSARPLQVGSHAVIFIPDKEKNVGHPSRPGERAGKAGFDWTYGMCVCLHLPDGLSRSMFVGTPDVAGRCALLKGLRATFRATSQRSTCMEPMSRPGKRPKARYSRSIRMCLLVALLLQQEADRSVHLQDLLFLSSKAEFKPPKAIRYVALGTSARGHGSPLGGDCRPCWDLCTSAHRRDRAVHLHLEVTTSSRVERMFGSPLGGHYQTFVRYA